MISRGEICQRIPKIHADDPLIYRFISLLLLQGELILVIGHLLCRSKAKHNVILIIAFLEGVLLDEGMLWVLFLELGLIGVLGHCGFVTADGEVAVAISVGLGNGNRLLGVLFLVL